jgi:hypothetical protein
LYKYKLQQRENIIIMSYTRRRRELYNLVEFDPGFDNKTLESGYTMNLVIILGTNLFCH